MFSVVIPLYNKGHTIVGTLQSVLAQGYPDFEVIVVDDGSTDDGPAIISREFTDPRIRLMHQGNQGAAAARNRGVEAAAFELIAFLDGDDLWRPTYPTTMKRAAELFPTADMYCCAGVIRNPDGSGLVRYSARLAAKTQMVDYFRNPSFFGNASSIVVRKSAFAETDGFPVGIGYSEDRALFFQLAQQTAVVFCPAVLAVYRTGVPGQATARRHEAYPDRIAVTNMLYRRWIGRPPAERNPLVLVEIKRSLRWELRQLIRRGDHEGVRWSMHAVDPRLLGELGGFERMAYPNPALKFLSITWLYATAARWRLRRYPRPRFRRNVDAALV